MQRPYLNQSCLPLSHSLLRRVANKNIFCFFYFWFLIQSNCICQKRLIAFSLATPARLWLSQKLLQANEQRNKEKTKSHNLSFFSSFRKSCMHTVMCHILHLITHTCVCIPKHKHAFCVPVFWNTNPFVFSLAHISTNPHQCHTAQALAILHYG